MPRNFLQEFQAANGLVADGVFGRKTANKMMEVLGIKTKENFAVWWPQVEHESAHCTAGRENLNYSADGLVKTWPSRFRHRKAGERTDINQGSDGKAIAEFYHRDPRKIANRVYANRMGNGNEASGDGWKNRGVGALQLTGKDNIQAYFKWAGLPPHTDPEELLKPEHYFRTAVWFFDVNNVWKNCYSTSKECVIATSKHVNLGNPDAKGNPIGLHERLALTAKTAKIMGIA